jgi:hypothetical protein
LSEHLGESSEVAANGLENYDKAVTYFQKYIDLGGKSSDAYLTISNIYGGPKENKEEREGYSSGEG